MCGIGGILDLEGSCRNFSQHIQSIAAQMHSRGPDDEGYLVAWHQNKKPLEINKNNTALASFESSYLYKLPPASLFLSHKRLSILDLSSSGHQPMATDDQRFWIVYNGEIYNFLEIKNELEQAGYVFKSYTDSEVLLKAYQHWGAEVLEKLNGMFAFAIWDDKKKGLFCARDRIGEKPFYYAIERGCFIFASTIRAVLASNLVPAAVDTMGLYFGLSFGVCPRPQTSFQNIKSLPPAHWLKITAQGQIEINSYWKLKIGIQQDLSLPCAVEKIKYLIDDSVRIRLKSDVPIAVLLSGGIDSTIIASLARKYHNDITAFTLSFTNLDKLDESQEAAETARLHNINHIIEKIDINSILKDVEEIIETYEEPFYDLSPNYLICKAISKYNTKVVLSGIGGDELFGGYKYYSWIHYWKILQKIRYLFLIGRKLPFINHISERLLYIAQSKDGAEFSCSVRSFLTDAEKRRLFQSTECQNVNTINHLYKLYIESNKLSFSETVEAMNYMELMNYLGNHHLYRLDAFTMKFSLEGRLPLLDHRLIEAAFSLPSKFKVKNGKRKYILRQITKEFSPPTTLKMRKKGFDLPTDQWLRGPLKDYAHEKLNSLSNRDFFHSNEIRKIHSSWEKGGRSFRGVWQLVSTEVWLEKFFDKKIYNASS